MALTDETLDSFRQTSYSKASERARGGHRPGRELRALTSYFDLDTLSALKEAAELNANSLSAQVRAFVVQGLLRR